MIRSTLRAFTRGIVHASNRSVCIARWSNNAVNTVYWASAMSVAIGCACPRHDGAGVLSTDALEAERPIPEGSAPDDAKRTAYVCVQELPVRLAHRVAELENLPHGLSEKKRVLKV